MRKLTKNDTIDFIKYAFLHYKFYNWFLGLFFFCRISLPTFGRTYGSYQIYSFIIFQRHCMRPSAWEPKYSFYIFVKLILNWESWPRTTQLILSNMRFYTINFIIDFLDCFSFVEPVCQPKVGPMVHIRYIHLLYFKDTVCGLRPGNRNIYFIFL